MDIDIHLERVRKALYERKYFVGVEIENLRKLSAGNNRAQIKAIIHFFDDSFLHFSEIVETGKCYPQVIKYSYQYMKDAEQIFRYDNASHHAHIATYPDHKHVGTRDKEQILASSCPNHEDLFEEIRTFIENNHVWK